MIIISFTQCDVRFSQDAFCESMSCLAIEPRLKCYENVLVKPDEITYSWHTLDEHFLLVAQWMKRRGIIKALTFVSHCHCDGRHDIRVIPTDEQGDMVGEPHHGFFAHRLKYLR